MKIVHAIARLNLGGAALSVLELAAGQRRHGHDVLVVAGAIPPGEESMEHVADELGVPWVKLPQLQREVSPWDDARAVAALRRILRERRPDVLHTHTAKAGTVGRTAALAAGGARPRVVVHTFHGHVLTGYFSSRRERVFRGIERLLARRTSAIVAVSDEVRDDLIRLGIAPADKIAVVPYGFDLDARVHVDEGVRATTRARLGLRDSTFAIGWVGRLTAVKRPLDLVQTLRALLDRGVDAALVVVGDGEERAALEQLGLALDVSENILLEGYQTSIAPYYAAFDVLLLTSENEGTPVVAIEALAAGTPVVATDVGGVAAVVDDGETGLLAPKGDVQRLAEHLERLAHDPELRRSMGSLGATRMRERFATERMVDAVQRLYDRSL